MTSKLTALIPCLLASFACTSTSTTTRVVSPRALAATEPVPVNETDDAAIWIHPADPAQSLLLVANEKRGLEVHDMDGLLLKHLNDGLHPNNIDLLYDVPLGSERADLVLGTCFAPESAGVKTWRIDSVKRKVIEVGTSVTKVLDGETPLGLCTYTSKKTGKRYFFVTSAKGRIEQWELNSLALDHIDVERVRALDRPTKTEGCVADDERGVVYFAEEDVGVWRFGAEPDDATQGELVVKVGDNGLIADVEGLALYSAREGRGYLIVVSQGAKGATSKLFVYERAGANAFVLVIDPDPTGFGPLERTSGIAVTNRPTIAALARGALVVNDHGNPNASEDFKIYAWEDVAEPGNLVIDTEWSARGSR